MLDTIGIQAREWALVGRNGNDVYAEPRGLLLAGYRWPQYSVHRGQLQMLLYRTGAGTPGAGRRCGWATASPAIASATAASRPTTLHQIGVPCVVFEAVAELQPLGVGINLQPNAVRELYDLGLGADVLDTIGIQAREWALVGRNGNDVYAEPRGLLAGYRWPQYSVHRGQLQMLLTRGAANAWARTRCGWATGSPATARHDGGVTALVQTRDGQTLRSARPAAGGRRRPALGRARADAPAAAAHPVGRRDHVARHHAGRAHPQRRVLRRRGLGAAPRGAVPDLAARPGHRPGHHQLDRRDHGGQPRRLDAGRLEPPRGAGRLRPPLRRLELRLARRAGACCAARRRSSSTR